jgi:hypothetical protein
LAEALGPEELLRIRTSVDQALGNLGKSGDPRRGEPSPIDQAARARALCLRTLSELRLKAPEPWRALPPKALEELRALDALDERGLVLPLTLAPKALELSPESASRLEQALSLLTPEAPWLLVGRPGDSKAKTSTELSTLLQDLAERLGKTRPGKLSPLLLPSDPEPRGRPSLLLVAPSLRPL